MRRVALFVAFIVAQIIFVLALVACGENPPTEDVSSGVQWQKVSGTGAVARVTVDGVDCVIYDDYNSGGIDCDWKEG